MNARFQTSYRAVSLMGYLLISFAYGQPTIGDSVPDLPISKLIRHPVGTATLHDFKDKLLILDFWDTHCGSCIAALPKLDSLNRELPDEAIIIPVTHESRETVERFLAMNPIGKRIGLPMAVSDSALRKYFKHRVISHVVWINNGTVAAITGTDHVTGGNIREMLEGNAHGWPTKIDRSDYNPSAPLLEQQPAGMSFTFTGYLPGVPPVSGQVTDSLSMTTRYFHINYDLAELYRRVLPPPEESFAMIPSRVIIDTDRPELVMYRKDYGPREDWMRANGCAYEAILADSLPMTEKRKQMAEQLGVFTGIGGKWERRETNCLVVRRLPGEVPYDERGEGRALRIKDVRFVLDFKGIYPPVVDETGYGGHLYLPGWENLEELNTLLNRQGFEIVEDMREVDVLVLTADR